MASPTLPAWDSKNTLLCGLLSLEKGKERKINPSGWTFPSQVMAAAEKMGAVLTNITSLVPTTEWQRKTSC